MAKNELREEIERAKKEQITKRYTAAESEKIRQDAAEIFERYEQEMEQKILKQQMKDFIRERRLYF